MNSLADRKITATLARLHREAAGDGERWARDRTVTSAALVRMGSLYLAVGENEGRMLYLLARVRRARRIVEFGASYGISTVYLGAAARDNGGSLITTEAHPKKCAAVRATLRKAGLSAAVEVLEGDARETLGRIRGKVDFVFLDGWKSHYLPVFNILKPKLQGGAMIVADNIDHNAARDYCAAVRRRNSGFISTTINNMEFSCYVR
jgi:predicted O-methyltransferase YrrM